MSLIDCGATSNFISSGVIQKLKLEICDTPIYIVEIGNGDKMKNRGVCKNLKFVVQGVEFEQFFHHGVRGTELVLGLDWLASLGNVEANFKNLCLKWKHEGQKHRIEGDPALCHGEASWKAMVKALNYEGVGFLIQDENEQAGTVAVSQLEAEWAVVINEFEDVFQLPQGLPPRREQDHAINLKTGAEIPHIRPYRYPHYQKNEIEKIVKEMLQTGIVTVLVPSLVQSYWSRRKMEDDIFALITEP